MPYGEGTYGSKVGRPPKKKNDTNKTTKKSKNTGFIGEVMKRRSNKGYPM
jgi:hypothetical protein|tara:strand:+ start:383 stop:532 length:150 start_codon:yes stop_codon:yes gene_type:complete